MSAHAGIPPGRGTALPVVAISRYQRARAALGDTPETRRIADALEASVAERPDAGVVIPGTIVRVLHSRRYGAFPALRLYYSVAEGAVHLLWIEHYDEMEA
jgi:hypothetical protein